MVVLHIPTLPKIPRIPLLQPHDQALHVHLHVHHPTKHIRLPARLLAGQIFFKGAAVDRPHADTPQLRGLLGGNVDPLDLHGEVRHGLSPDVPVAPQDGGAGASDLEGVVDVRCVGGVESEPGVRGAGAPGGSPAVGEGGELRGGGGHCGGLFWLR